MARDQLSVARALAVALAFSLPLAGCGRKGPLSPPPDTSLPTPPPAASQGGTVTNPTAPVAAPPAPAPAPKKSFLLDPLIQ